MRVRHSKRSIIGCALLIAAFGIVGAQGFVLQTEHSDYRAVMIKGPATGYSGEPSKLAINVNGIEFAITFFPDLSASLDSESASPGRTCDLFRDQVSAYTEEASPTAEFNADCVPVAGKGSLLLLQANPQKYEVPRADEPAFDRWVKAHRRQLHVDVSSNDDTQKLRLVK
jgi:hypothetical protein